MSTTYTYPIVLSIAGFDGSGGAGIQADLKSISALGCYAATVLTALPVQNTTGVKSIFSIPEQVVSEQLQVFQEDMKPDAIKIGMVHSTKLVNVIADFLKQNPNIPVVFDPVMVATSGDQLIEDDTIEAIKSILFPLATIITPNMDEASVLTAKRVKNLEDMLPAGEEMLSLGCHAILLKGGHLPEKKITSFLFQPTQEVQTYSFQKYATQNTHGSGCTLSSAIASFLALQKDLAEAVQLGQDYIHQAIFHGKDIKIGKGNGPVNHFFNPQPLNCYELDNNRLEKH